jgi:hypothetical protein
LRARGGQIAIRNMGAGAKTRPSRKHAPTNNENVPQSVPQVGQTGAQQWPCATGGPPCLVGAENGVNVGNSAMDMRAKAPPRRTRWTKRCTQRATRAGSVRGANRPSSDDRKALGMAPAGMIGSKCGSRCRNSAINSTAIHRSCASVAAVCEADPRPAQGRPQDRTPQYLSFYKDRPSRSRGPHRMNESHPQPLFLFGFSFLEFLSDFFGNF